MKDIAVPEIGTQDREVRLRFLRIDAATGEALREIWPKVAAALPDILEVFTHTSQANRSLLACLARRSRA